MNKSIGIIGGDLRIVKLTNIFLQEGYTINVYGNDKCRGDMWSLENTQEQINTIISSIPLSRDGETIYAPFSEEKIYIEELFPKIKNKTLICRWSKE